MKPFEEVFKMYHDMAGEWRMNLDNLASLHPDSHIVFGAEEPEYVSKDSVIEMDVYLAGEKIGVTRACGELDNDVIRRNMIGMKRVGVKNESGHHNAYSTGFELTVDKDNKRIDLTPKKF